MNELFVHGPIDWLGRGMMKKFLSVQIRRPRFRPEWTNVACSGAQTGLLAGRYFLQDERIPKNASSGEPSLKDIAFPQDAALK